MSEMLRAALATALLAGPMIAPAAHIAQAGGVPLFSARDAGERAGIDIDGRLDDAAWEAAPAFEDFHTYWPREGIPAPVKTVVRFVRDARSFYVAARMYDPDILRLRAGLARRDSFSNEQDWFAIFIDPVGTSRLAQMFYVNAHGVIYDGLANDDAGTASAAADFDVEVGTRVEGDSWTVELRIPFSELRYPSGAPRDWNVLLRRNYPRDERYALSAPATPTRASCFVCLAGPFAALGTLPAPEGISFVPQVVGTGRGEGEGTSNLDWHSSVEPGIEVKYRATASTVLDATLNPDFSQVELDTPQLSSNQQFAVVFPEKRPFFLEGLDILDSPLQAIYTRSITDPAWGLRATHRGGWDGVWFSTRDDGGGLVVVPSDVTTRFAPQSFASLATVGRLRVPVGAATFGALVTDRRADEGHNTVAGADLAWRPTGDARVRAQWLSSRTRGSEDFPGIGAEQSEAAQGDAISMDWLHENRHWRSTLTLERLDEEFRADNGFIPQVGVQRTAGELRYKFVGLGPLSELAPYVTSDVREDLDGNTVRSTPRAGVAAVLPRNTLLTAEWRPRERLRLRADSQVREAQQAYISLSSNPISRIPVLTFAATFGEAMDFAADRVGRGETLSASLLVRPASRLEIEPRLEWTTVRTRGDAGGAAQEATETAAQLLATLHLTARDRLRLIVQRVSIERDERGTGALIESNDIVGSLLYTHERSLATRLYTGVTMARASGLSAVEPTDTLEVFVKVQVGFSSDAGLRW